MPIVPAPKKGDAESTRRAVQKLAYKLGPKGHPVFADLTVLNQKSGMIHTNSVGRMLAGGLYVPEYGGFEIPD